MKTWKADVLKVLNNFLNDRWFTSGTSGFEMQTSGSPLVSFLTEPEF